MEHFIPELAFIVQLLFIAALYLEQRARRSGLARYGTFGAAPLVSNHSAGSDVSVTIVHGVRVETGWRLTVGEPSTVETAVLARFEMPFDLGLKISSSRTPRTLRHYLDRASPEAVSGPNTIVAHGDEPARVAALLGNGLGPRLVALSAHADVRLDDEAVSLSTERAVLEPWRAWARREIVSIVFELERNRRALRSARALAGFAADYARLASTLGLRWTNVPLAMWGQIDGIDVYARAIRRAKEQYALVISARAPRDASGGLVVRRRARFVDLRPRRGERVSVPDTSLVEKLDIRAARPELAALVLSEGFRGDLKELTLWGNVELSDGTIWLELARVPDAAELAGHIDLLVRLGCRLCSDNRCALRDPASSATIGDSIWPL